MQVQIKIDWYIQPNSEWQKEKQEETFSTVKRPLPCLNQIHLGFE